jgi:hypothetical protein
MHGNVSRLRKKTCRPAQVAEDWLTREQQLEQALALIQPTPGERELCTDRISPMLDGVQYEKEEEEAEEAGGRPEVSLEPVVEALRAAEAALVRLQREKAALSRDTQAAETKRFLLALSVGADAWRRGCPVVADRHNILLARIEKEREFIEGRFLSAKTKDRPGQVKSLAKSMATTWAWQLLDEFGPHRPGLTEGGTWHQLAATLFGYVTADMLSFDYLRDTHRGIRKSRGQPRV